MDSRLAQRLGITARRARTARRLTQADVAERVGIATEVYGRLERGKMLPSVETLQRLCSALDVSADELLGLGAATSALPVAREATARYEADAHLRPVLRTLRALQPSQVRLLERVAKALVAGSKRPGR